MTHFIESLLVKMGLPASIGHLVSIFFLLVLLQSVMVSPSDDEFDLLMRQLRIRIAENQGECVYTIGESGKVPITFVTQHCFDKYQ